MNDLEMFRAENAHLRALLEEGLGYTGPVPALTAWHAHWIQVVQEATDRPHHERDRALLSDLTEREARIADAAARLAYDKAADWLSSKQAEAEQYPGGDLVHARGRASAYQNAAQEIYGWAIRHGDSDA